MWYLCLLGKKKLSNLPVLQVLIRRRPLLYVVGLLIPSIFLMLVDVISFYLPLNSRIRIVFKVSILLGYTVFRVNMTDELPSSALRTPLIGGWLFRASVWLLFLRSPCTLLVSVNCLVKKTQIFHFPVEWNPLKKSCRAHSSFDYPLKFILHFLLTGIQAA